MNEDTTVIDGAAAGMITFETLPGSISSSATLTLGQCDYCLVNGGSLGHATPAGDSVKISFGLDPSFRLLGVYRGDSISGRLESFASASGPTTNTYWGTFVARRAEQQPTVTLAIGAVARRDP